MAKTFTSKAQKSSPSMKTYMNNPRLKGVGVNMKFTQEQIQERILCTQDPIYFMEKYIKIVDVDEGLVPLEMYPFQKELVRSYNENRFTLGCLSRQLGKSTITVAYILWTILFGPMHNIAILANKASTARDILAKLCLAYEHIPLWMQQGVKSFNKGSIELENGSRVIAGATSSSATRGNAFSIIFLDEFAFVHDNIAEEFFTSVFPTISSGETTKLIMISTPNGMNLFHKFYVEAKEGRSPYHLIEANWQARTERDDVWYKQQLDILGEEKFRQEHLCEFHGSANTLISGVKLGRLAWKEPLKRMGFVDVYEEPKKENFYIMCVDVARGGGGDYSTCTVFDCTQIPYKIVAKYRNNKINSYVFHEVVHNIATIYNRAHVLIESNDVGKQVADGLFHELAYENIFCTTQKNRNIMMNDGLAYGPSRNTKMGVFTTSTTKRIGCSNLKALIETDKLLFEDRDIIEELYSFVHKGNTSNTGAAFYGAEMGKNDDLVMTMVQFAWLTTQPLFKNMTNGNIRQNLSEEYKTKDSLFVLPFGILADGTEENKEVDDQGDVWEGVPEDIQDQIRFFREQDYFLGNDDDDRGSGNL